MRAWFFCPENDLALADGGARYTPPAGALAVARAGRLLPMLWASDDDVVIVPRREWQCEATLEVAGRLRSLYGARGRVVCETDLTGYDLAPWGWSRYTRTLLNEAGMHVKQTYDDEALDRIRTLSHRSISIRVNTLIGEQGISIPPLPVEARSFGDVVALSRDYERMGYRGVVVKLPWSCSSRGVVMADSERVAAISGQLEGMIRRQGSVMVEPWLERGSDFAMLFESDGEGSVAFRAVSTFVTDIMGRYGGNVIGHQEALKAIVGELPHELVQAVENALGDVIGHDYKGWLGVDMMRYTHDRFSCIAPCVEVNLRMTMGVAAYLTATRMLTDGLLGYDELRLLTVTPAGISLPPYQYVKDFKRV